MALMIRSKTAPPPGRAAPVRTSPPVTLSIVPTRPYWTSTPFSDSLICWMLAVLSFAVDETDSMLVDKAWSAVARATLSLEIAAVFPPTWLDRLAMSSDSAESASVRAVVSVWIVAALPSVRARTLLI